MPTVLRFDRFELQLTERRLLRDGVEVPLRAKTFNLLVALAERAGHLVTKDELLDIVWPGLVVEENNIAAQMAALRRALQSPLIVTVPGHGYRFVGRFEQDEDAPAFGVTPAPAPPTTAAAGRPLRLFGREQDLARLGDALGGLQGILTLVGPGGVGKTTLARALAARESVTPAWIDLAALSAPPQVEPGVLRALGLTIDADLLPAAAQALERQPRLLVLDNAEHLVDAVAATLSRLADAVPGLRVLVTSQQPLAIAGEQVERVEPLGWAMEGATPGGAVAMLLDRVHAADSRFVLGVQAMPLVQSLCAALDGLPLALEMAAARVPLIGLQRVHDAMHERFALLHHRGRELPSRHRSLQAALDWSHELLSAQEQATFHVLGVFADGFSVELAMDVLGAGDDEDPWANVDRIATLVDHSLVVSDHADPPRYRLLESARHYALDRLGDASAQRIRRRLLDALHDVFAAAESTPADDVSRPQRRVALQEMGNVRAILPWARDHAPQAAVSMGIAVCGVATFTPWRLEAAGWLESLEPLVEGELPETLKARWWRQFATQTLFRGSARAVDVAQKSHDVCRAAGDEQGRFWSLVVLARALLRVQPLAQVEARAAAAVDEMQDLADRHPDWPANMRAVALGTRAFACLERGDPEAALTHWLAEQEVARAAGLINNEGAAAHNVAYVLSKLGRQAEALQRIQARLADPATPTGDTNAVHARILVVRLLLQLDRIDAARSALPAAIEASRSHGMPDAGFLVALTVALEGRPRAAAVLLGHALAAFAARDVPEPDDDEALQRLRALLQERVDPAMLQSLVERGRRIGPAEADRLIGAQEDA